jgi:hypothetical protein
MSTPGRLDIIGDVLKTLEAGVRTDESLGKWCDALSEHIGELWQDNADLRDELHAVANRLEALTRAVGPHAA